MINKNEVRLLSGLSPEWLSHLLKRFKQAKELGVIEDSLQTAPDARAFLPADENSCMTSAGPDLDLNQLGKTKNKSGWVLREDLMSESAEFITRKYADANCSLFCLHPLAKDGDGFLSGRNYIVRSQSVFLCEKIQAGSEKKIEEILRICRTPTLLATIELSIEPLSNETKSIAFLCDAARGDSIIICSLEESTIGTS